MTFVYGIISIFFFALNTVFWSSVFFIFYFLKFITPTKTLRKLNYNSLLKLAALWIKTNNLYIDWILPTRVHVSVPKDLSEQKSYLIISNHSSWVDILILQYAFNNKTPFLRFFIKDSLRWVPLLGQAWMALDFPFMKRNSGASKAVGGERRNRDLLEAKRACGRMLGKNVSVLIFLEGTRFTPEKHAAKNSVFRFLLPPKSGGTSAVLDVLGPQIDCLIDSTIFYVGGPKSFWQFMCGKLRDVHIEARTLQIPTAFKDGSLEKNKDLRLELQDWFNQIWNDKDKKIDQITNKKT